MTSFEASRGEKIKQRAVLLTDAVWKRVRLDAAEKGVWPNEIAERAIKWFFLLESGAAPKMGENGKARRHNLRIKNELWLQVKTFSIQADVTASQALEIILRRRYDMLDNPTPARDEDIIGEE